MKLHEKYTTSASILQIKVGYSLTDDEVADKIQVDVELVKKWIIGVEQMCFKNYIKVIKVFSEMRGRIDYA